MSHAWSGAIFSGWPPAAARGFPVRRSLGAYAPAAVWSLGIWLVGGATDVPAPSTALPLDKLGHIAIYGVLGWLLARGWTRLGAATGPWWPLLFALALAVADELRQRAVPGRMAETGDVIADIVGVAIGFVVALRLDRSRRLEPQER